MGLEKKKRIDEVKPVSFRKLTIREQKTTGGKTQAPKTEKTVDGPANHLLAIENPINKENETDKGLTPNQPMGSAVQHEAPTGGLGALKKIRDQIQNRKQEKSIVLSLSDEKLNEAWSLYLEKLAANNQVTSHSNLKQAKLGIQDETNFEVKAESKIQLQFIEGERLGMTLHLQEFFNNNKIQYKVVLDVTAENMEKPTEQLMSRKDQYLKMAELYPIIKNMRDQLNLDLDY